MNRRPKIHDEKIHDDEDWPPAKALAPAFRVVDPSPTPATPASPHSPYRNLRSLPGYSLGDALRPDDAATLCDSEEATVAVVGMLRPTDCAFVLRSDGAFTYSLYEGPWSEDGQSSSEGGEGEAAAALLFRLNDDGNFKVVVRDELLGGRIKIPVLPTTLAANVQGQGKKASRRSSMKCNPTVEPSTHSRRRFSYTPRAAGPRMDAVLEVQEWANQQDEGSEASLLQGSSSKASRRFSTWTEDPPAATPAETAIQVQKAPRRSSTRCHPTVEQSRPSRRRFSYAPGGQQRSPPRTGGDLRPIRSLPKLSSTTTSAAATSAGRHRSFFVGDLFPSDRVPVVDRADNDAAVSRLEVGDAAFVKRSCGRSYSYSSVIQKDEESITFRVTDEGNTKKFPRSKAGKFVIVGDVARAGAGGAREESSDDGDATCGDETRGGVSTVAALPSDPPPAGELLAAPSYLPKRKGGTGTTSASSVVPGGKNASQRRDSKFSSSTSVTSLCSMASMDDDGSGTFHASERAVIGSDPAVDAAPKTSAAADTEPPRGEPRGPSPTGSPKKKKPPVEHHKAGTKVLYKGPSGVLVEARILAAHHDDELEPYYTIELSCGREKQTDEAHLVAFAAP